MIIDSDKIVALLRRVAAEQVMPAWRHLGKNDIGYKAGDEPVTVADHASELALSAGLRELLPGSMVVGEEGVANDPTRLALLAGDDWVWIVDPIDGTRNFAAGRPHFAVMIALARGGVTEGAWIYAPALESLGVAERGEGACLQGTACHIELTARPASELRGTLHAGQFAPRDLAQKMSRRRDRVVALRSMGSAGIEYLRLLDGEMDFSFFSKLKPWDHAPGCLLLSEAGGIARFSDCGNLYTPLQHKGEGLLLAPDEESWQRLHAVLLA